GQQRFVLRVDRLLFVAAGLQVAPGEDEASSTAIVGEAAWRGRVVSCLDADRLGFDGLLPMAPPSGAAGDVLDRRTEGAGEQAGGAANDLALVVEVAGTPYGLPSSSVVEVLEQATLTALPLVPAEVLGVMALRRQPLLVLSLAALQNGQSLSASPSHVVV